MPRIQLSISGVENSPGCLCYEAHCVSRVNVAIYCSDGMGKMFVPRDSGTRLRPLAELKKAQTVTVLLGIILLLIVVAAAFIQNHRRLVGASGSQPSVEQETRK